MPLLDFYRQTPTEWNREMQRKEMNGTCDLELDQIHYQVAAASISDREGRRVVDRGPEAWVEYIDRDLIYLWLAKHAQRSAVLDRRETGSSASIEDSGWPSWNIVTGEDDSHVSHSREQPSHVTSALPYGTAVNDENSQQSVPRESPVDDTQSLNFSLSSASQLLTVEAQPTNDSAYVFIPRTTKICDGLP